MHQAAFKPLIDSMHSSPRSNSNRDDNTPASAPASDMNLDSDVPGNAGECNDATTEDILKLLTEEEIEKAFRELEGVQRVK